MIFLLIGFVLITVALTIMCHGVGDGNWWHSLLYVLISYAVLAMFGLGIFFLVLAAH